MNRNGQSLVEAGIGIMVVAIVFIGIAIPIAADTLTSKTSLNKYTNETHNSSGAVPDVFTVNNVGDGVVADSETIYLEDSFDGTVHLLAASDYTLDTETGEFNVTTADLDGDAGNEINSSNDQYLVTYKSKPDGYIGGITATVVNFVPLALALVVFVAAMGLVR